MIKLRKFVFKKNFAIVLTSIYASGAIAATNSYSFTVDFSLAAKRTGITKSSLNNSQAVDLRCDFS